MSTGFISLRARLLLPILAAALVTAGVVTSGSYVLGDRQVQQNIDRRFQSIVQTVAPGSFPLTAAVLQTLGHLSGTPLVALAEDGSVVRSTLENAPGRAMARPAAHAGDPGSATADRRRSLRRATTAALRGWSPETPSVWIDGRRFHVRMVSRRPDGTTQPPISRVAVLFDHRALRQARLQAAALPLLTGLSTIFVLTAVTLLLTGRLVRRLGRLQQRVERIAQGDFDTSRPQPPTRPEIDDEVGTLQRAVDRMAGDLQQLWSTVQQQERDKLLHQMAAGLAHQLRNSLTGARIALDLHAAGCDLGLDQGLQVAVRELERVEAYVRRILLIASGRQEADRPGNLAECLQDVRQSLAPVSRHLGVQLAWQITPLAAQRQIADAATLSMAVSNLVLNALQAQGRQVAVSAEVAGSRLTVRVTDDGAGPPTEIGDRLFEPFVSTKPEGLGLGLPLVRRAAEKLGGAVSWRREPAGRTVFEMQVRLMPQPTPADTHEPSHAT